MSQITVKVSAKQSDVAYVESMLEGLVKAQGVVLRTAVNETLRRFRTRLTDLLSREHLVGKHDVRERVFIAEGAHKDSYEGRLAVSHARVPLYDFKIRFTKRGGARVQMLASKGPEVFKHAFKGTMDTGHVGAFQRVKGAAKIAPARGKYAFRTIKRGPRKGQLIKRQPIKELFGPPVVRAFDVVEGLIEEASGDLETMFDDILDRKLKWQLEKAGR